jgi:signal transduction histidine kinase
VGPRIAPSGDRPRHGDAVRLLAELVAAESREEGAAARARVGQLAGLIVDEARQLDALRSEVLEGGRIEEVRVDLVAGRILAGARLVTDAEFTAELSPAVADGRAVSFERLVSNLLTNAVQAAGPGGRVDLRVGPTEGGAIVTMEDSGPGFPPHSDPAWSTSRPDEAPRRALGLLIVDGIVRQCHGQIDVGRSRLGGANVRIWLPHRRDEGRHQSLNP